MATAQILDVFVDQAGKFGDGMGIFIDESGSISSRDRRLLTERLGFVESVFVNNARSCKVSVFTPRGEVPFAGQPMVGTAWMLSQMNDSPISKLYCQGGAVQTWQSAGLTWIQAKLDVMPPWRLLEMTSPEAVEAVTDAEAVKMEHTLVWAWSSRAQGHIRARTFAGDWDIPEPESNGSGSMMLAASLGTELEVKHGQGSVIYARPIDSTHAAVGGRVVKRREVEVNLPLG